MKWFYIILIFIWQLPQNIVGALVWLYFKCLLCCKVVSIQTFPRKRKNSFYDNLWIITISSSKMNGGVTLGQFVFLNDRMCDTFHMKHEGGGHGKQSLILGPFYLLVIGIPSLVHAALHKTGNYYHFWTERWANKLGDVE